jgi:hypothetical protein
MEKFWGKGNKKGRKEGRRTRRSVLAIVLYLDLLCAVWRVFECDEVDLRCCDREHEKRIGIVSALIRMALTFGGEGQRLDLG